jgi:hypothetical protein
MTGASALGVAIERAHRLILRHQTVNVCLLTVGKSLKRSGSSALAGLRGTIPFTLNQMAQGVAPLKFQAGSLI